MGPILNLAGMTGPSASCDSPEGLSWECPDCHKRVEPYYWTSRLEGKPTTRYYPRKFCDCPAGQAKLDAWKQTQLPPQAVQQVDWMALYRKANQLPSEAAGLTPKRWDEPYFKPRTDLVVEGVNPQTMSQLLIELRKYADKLLDPSRPYVNAWLGGKTSVGKSHLAEALCFYVREQYGRWDSNPWKYAVRFIDWPVAMDLVEASWDRTKAERTEEERDPWGFPSEDEIWDPIAHAWFLVIDGIDIVRSRWTPYRINNIYKMLQFREANALPTVFTANCRIRGLQSLKSMMLTAPTGREEIIEAVLARIERRLAVNVYISGTPYKLGG